MRRRLWRSPYLQPEDIPELPPGATAKDAIHYLVFYREHLSDDERSQVLMFYLDREREENPETYLEGERMADALAGTSPVLKVCHELLKKKYAYDNGPRHAGLEMSEMAVLVGALVLEPCSVSLIKFFEGLEDIYAGGGMREHALLDSMFIEDLRVCLTVGTSYYPLDNPVATAGVERLMGPITRAAWMDSDRIDARYKMSCYGGRLLPGARMRVVEPYRGVGAEDDLEEIQKDEAIADALGSTSPLLRGFQSQCRPGWEFEEVARNAGAEISGMAMLVGALVVEPCGVSLRHFFECLEVLYEALGRKGDCWLGPMFMDQLATSLISGDVRFYPLDQPVDPGYVVSLMGPINRGCAQDSWGNPQKWYPDTENPSDYAGRC